MTTFREKILAKYNIDLSSKEDEETLEEIKASYKTSSPEEFEKALNHFTKYVVDCLDSFLNSFDIPFDAKILADISNSFLKQHALNIINDYDNTMKKIQNAFEKIILASHQPNSLAQKEQIEKWTVNFTKNVTIYIEKIRLKTDEFLSTTSKAQIGERLFQKLELIKNLTVEDILEILKG